MLDQALGFLDDHLGNCHVPCRWFVKGRTDNLTLHRPLHVGNFLGPLINQKDDQITFRMVLRDAAGDVLQQNSLTRPWRGNNQRPLPFTDGRHQIDNTGRTIPRCRIVGFHRQTLVRIKRREVIESDLVLHTFRIFKIDPCRVRQSKIAFRIIRRLDNAFDRVPSAQRILADHVGRHIDIIRTRQIVCLRRPQETKAVLQNFQNTIARYFPSLIRAFAEDLEHHLAFAHGRGILDLKLFSHVQQIFGAFRLQLGKRQTLSGLSHFIGHGNTHIAPRNRRSGSVSYMCCCGSRTGRLKAK
mmetsp:Transcript_18535/g.30416  ORF Transcript_18535/g.30416 Transcript_18535/m.30416 type:complete len:299 (+) Transcript_18535:12857-13753(+)